MRPRRCGPRFMDQALAASLEAIRLDAQARAARRRAFTSRPTGGDSKPNKDVPGGAEDVSRNKSGATSGARYGPNTDFPKVGQAAHLIAQIDFELDQGLGDSTPILQKSHPEVAPGQTSGRGARFRHLMARSSGSYFEAARRRGRRCSAR